MLRSFVQGWKARQGQESGYEIERRRVLAQHAQEMSAYRRLMVAAKAKVAAGSTLLLGGGALALADAAVDPGLGIVAATGAVLAGVGGVSAYRGHRDGKALTPPQQPMLPVPPPPPLPKGTPGSAAADSIAASRDQLMVMLPTVERIHPEAAAELRRADAQAAPIMAALVERMRHLMGVRAQMPDTQAAHMAGVSVNNLAGQLATGARTYDELLAAVVELLSAAEPLSDQVLRPSIIELQAYAAGLQRMADTW